MLESLFSKAAGPQTSNFIEKRLQYRCFPFKLAKFLHEHLLLQNNSSGPFRGFCSKNNVIFSVIMTTSSYNQKLS